MLLSTLVDSSVEMDVEVHGVSSSSDSVSNGLLFVAVSGYAHDGADFIPDAVARGAVAIIVENSKKAKIEAFDLPTSLSVVWVDNSRVALAQVASQFYAVQPDHVAAVTGTSGKSSVVWFVRQILDGLGFPCASFGTIGLHAGGTFEKSALTTADPITLHKSLVALSDQGVSYLAMEASSIGIEQHRMDGVRLKVAAYTNLSHEHLDYHSDMESYFKAKARLFAECLPVGGYAVLNADTPEYQKLADICVDRGVKIIPYGIHATGAHSITLVNRSIHDNGQDIVVMIAGQKLECFLPLIGSFQVHNVLCAIGMAYGLLDGAVNLELLHNVLVAMKTVPGRLEKIDGHPLGASVYVDYAHKSAALEAVINAVRPHTKGKLWLVFGCGGDRDRAKRSQMGQIAYDLADEVIVTDDNPRSEDPDDIRAEISDGFPTFKNIGDRRDAICVATSSLRTGDSLIIAGKGHESGQIFLAQTLPFDDRDETRLALKNLIEECKES